ncbi:MAG: PQQ-dependent sugar dehydrogenase [Sandaracinus sp.]|nr:PQQ-dependent sugar dehydrogenase [Sandaracinus sp.]
MRRSTRWACSLLLFAACGGDDDAPSTDAGPDATVVRDGGMTEDADVPPPDSGGGADAGVDAGPPACPSETIPMLGVEDIAPGVSFSAPIYATVAPGDTDTIYVVEKTGRIVLVRDGERVGTFLDVSGGLLSDGEQGLLGLAFHPGYADNGRFFLFFTPGSPRRNVVAEYRRSDADPDEADPTEVARLVEVNDSESNHNGGMIAFGPDGYLYVAMGDEGGGGDRHGMFGNGLNLSTLFGSILRLDVDAAGADYAAAGNPFSGAEGLPQIYHYGVRNPWRFSFDRTTGDLWIADVGQNVWEEIDVLPAGTPAGRNLGWAAYEGLSVHRAELVDRVADHYEPIVVYEHNDGSAPAGGVSITGGYVYRGSAIPSLRGWYLYGDYASPHVGAVRFCDGEVLSHERAPGLSGRGSGLGSFGEDANGELFVVYIGDGKVYRIVPG